MDNYKWLSTAPEQLMSDPNDPFRPGSVIDLGGMKVTVRAVDGTDVTVIRVEADVPLEDPSLHFVVPTFEGIVRFSMPAIGKAVTLPAPVLPLP